MFLDFLFEYDSHMFHLSLGDFFYLDIMGFWLNF
jgi:hypothetical protein